MPLATLRISLFSLFLRNNPAPIVHRFQLPTFRVSFSLDYVTSSLDTQCCMLQYFELRKVSDTIMLPMQNRI